MKCAQLVKSWELPLLVLGGGGYNRVNVARCWAHVTAALLDEELPLDIPEHPYFQVQACVVLEECDLTMRVMAAVWASLYSGGDSQSAHE